MSRRALSLGYPMGYSNINEMSFFNVQLNDRMYPLNLIGTYLWLGAMNLMSLEDIDKSLKDELAIKGYHFNEDYSDVDIKDAYNMLKLNSLIVEFDDEELVNLFKKINNFKFHRKGFGLGIKDENIIVLNNNEEIYVTPTQYLIWQLSDSNKDLNQIFDIVVKNIEYSVGNQTNIFDVEELKCVVMEDLMYLYQKDLISIV